MIDVVGVDKFYGDHHVLKHINLHVDKGEVVVIIGPSGAGKSTLLRCINYLETYQDGYVKLDGQYIGRHMVNGKSVETSEKDLNRMRRRIGMVFQSFNLFYNKTVLRNLTMAPMDLLGRSRAEAETRAMELLENVGLPEKASVMPASLSGGQKQRVAIARALAMDPEIMLFDEPTSALDPGSTLRIEDLMDELKKQYTVVIVTHNMQQAARISDQTAFFLTGTLVEYGPTKELFSNPKDKKTEDYITGRFG